MGKPKHSPGPGTHSQALQGKAELGAPTAHRTSRRSHEMALTLQHWEDQQPATTEPTQWLKQSFQRNSN